MAHQVDLFIVLLIDYMNNPCRIRCQSQASTNKMSISPIAFQFFVTEGA
jgi:hypothetical protein